MSAKRRECVFLREDQKVFSEKNRTSSQGKLIFSEYARVGLSKGPEGLFTKKSENP